MKIHKVSTDNRKKEFVVKTYARIYSFPYAISKPSPCTGNLVREVFVDSELGMEAFTFRLESGEEGTVHIDHVLEYNKDPGYLTDLLLYKLTLEAQKRFENSPLGTRAIIRRLGTSPAQFYRLLDQTCYGKSVRQMVSLLSVLGCDVELVVTDRARSSSRAKFERTPSKVRDAKPDQRDPKSI